MFSFVDIRVALLLSAAVLLARGLSEEDVPSRGCTYNGEMFGDKDKWKPDPCQFCTCNSGMVSCSMAACGFPEGCTNPIIPEGECCPICPDDVPSRGCTYDGKVYGDKDEWKPDPCQFCTCNSGMVSCGMAGCRYPSGCTNPIIPKGECCPICPNDVPSRGCTYDGKVYGDKDEWKPEPCQFCTCNSGMVSCGMTGCRYPSGCTKPIVPEGECCPICPNDGIWG